MRRHGPFLLAAFLVAVLSGLGGCDKNAPAANLGLSGAGAGNFPPGSKQEFNGRIGDTVHFEVDSSELTAEGRSILNAQAIWLRQYSSYPITVEGHADERGTREYNIALGARRGETTKNFLIAQGINSGRIRTISYGKERPVAVCDDISCWSQNRRTVTLLEGAGAVASY
ncbi:MAG: peptidoglycan-associated lipoprotein Pal [Rhodomicrobium sp.]